MFMEIIKNFPHKLFLIRIKKKCIYASIIEKVMQLTEK